MVKKLLHTRYRVSDLEKTIAFYRDVLGLELIRRHTSPRGSELVFFKAPGSEEEIEICKYDGSGEVKVGYDITHLAFEVDDLQATVDRLATDGYGLVGGIGQYEHTWRMAYVRGPEGIIVSLAERIG